MSDRRGAARTIGSAGGGEDDVTAVGRESGCMVFVEIRMVK